MDFDSRGNLTQSIESDTLDWLNQFSHTKPKKLGDKSFSKGFITIKF